MKQLTKFTLLAIIIFSGLFNALNLLAKSSDENAPLHIEADQLEIHDKESYSIYKGNVIINKGSLKITGDKIIIKNKDAKLHSIQINGTPATFFQLNDFDEAISAESNKMDYQAHSGVLELKQKATLIKNKNHFSSEHIIYNTLKDIVKAGDQNTEGTQAPPRVKITIYPQDKPTDSPNNTQSKH